jgi:peroxidase
LDASGQTIPAGNLSLAGAFFTPQEIVDHGIDSLLRGMAAQRAQEVDPHIVDEVRNFLFGGPGTGGFDLASLNVQRGRDHGLPSYNAARRELGLAPVSSFANINPDVEVQENLSLAFASVEDIDLWMGGLSEPHAPGALVGETFREILVDQFRRSRDGDRFWYQVYLPPELVAVVEQQTLAKILERNTRLGPEIPADVFHVPSR